MKTVYTAFVFLPVQLRTAEIRAALLRKTTKCIVCQWPHPRIVVLSNYRKTDEGSQYRLKILMYCLCDSALSKLTEKIQVRSYFPHLMDSYFI